MKEIDENHRIILVQKDRYLVGRADEELYCVLAGSLRYQEEFPVVGDYVKVIPNPYGDSLIRGIQPRRTVFCRPDRGGHADGFVKNMKVHLLVANIDYVFIITSLNNDFSVNRIARYAAMATAGGAIPVAALTKADVCPDVEALESQAAALSGNIQVVSVSAYTGFGMEKLRAYIKPGATIALLGSSGAGKSTLVNTLAGRDILRVGAIREKDSKGRHTTTQRQLIELDGASFIDTPGLREHGMIDAGEGIADTFSDIAELISQCAFSNCTHRTEPDCAIRRALEDGTLSPERWEMYARLERENRWSMDRKNDQMVSIALRRRELNHSGKSEDTEMKRKLINWFGLMGLLALLSYGAAVIFSPMAYPGYNWMAQAVSDLSAETAPSRILWNRLAAFYGTGSVVCATCVAIYVSDQRISTVLFRTGIVLFAAMNWVSAIGYKMFPLVDAGKEIASFQEVMHIVVTALVVLLSILSLVLLIISGIRNASVRKIGIIAAIALAMMMIGSIGTGVVPPQYFGIAERFSVFAAVGFNAVLGWYLFNGFKKDRRD